MSEQEFWEDEEDVALAALNSWMDIDGDDELAEAQRVTLTAIAQEAVELKEQREEEARRRARARRGRRRQEARRQQAEAWRAEERRREAREQQERERRQREARRRREAEARRAAEARRRREAEARARRSRQAAEARTASAANRPAPQAADARPTRAPRRRQRGRGLPARDGAPQPEQPIAVAGPVATGSASGQLPGPVGQPATRSADEAAPLTGADLAAWRKSLGLTQQAAADRFGVRQGTISKAEGRAHKPLGPTLRTALTAAVATAE